MIYWSTLEPHMPHRVCRQFGFQQGIPSDALLMNSREHRRIHSMSLRGRGGTDWRVKHHDYIAVWNNRANTLYVGTHGGGTTHEYFEWYYPRTVLSIGNPGRQQPANQYPEWGSQQNLYEEGLREMRTRATNIAQEHPESQPYVQDFFHIPQQMMEYTHHNQPFVNYGSQNYQFPEYDHNPTPQPRPHSTHATQENNSWVDNLFYQTPIRPTPAPMQDYSPYMMHHAGSSSHQYSQHRHDMDVRLGDDEEEDVGGDDQPQQDVRGEEPPRRQGRPRRHRRPTHCGTGGHLN